MISNKRILTLSSGAVLFTLIYIFNIYFFVLRIVETILIWRLIHISSILSKEIMDFLQIYVNLKMMFLNKIYKYGNNTNNFL